MEHTTYYDHRDNLRPLAERNRQYYMTMMKQVANASFIELENPTVAVAHPDVYEAATATLPLTDSRLRELLSPHTATEPRAESLSPAQRDTLTWLRTVRDALDPDAKITISSTGTMDKYFCLTGYESQTNEPDWRIAEHPEYGHATYLWRRDASPVSPDEALASTKRTARALGCLSIAHPPSYSGNPEDTATLKHTDIVLDYLTRPLV